MKVLALVPILCSSVYAQKPPSPPNPGCVVNFTIATQDALKNMNWGFSPKDMDWVGKLGKKYPGVCYADPGSHSHVILFLTVTPDTYRGTRTIRSEDSAYEKPYSVDYGIYTLMVERLQSDGSLKTLQTFQQKGLYSEMYGIPLGGRGHHPAHAVIEDAVKWLSKGGLSDPNQGSTLVSDQP